MKILCAFCNATINTEDLNFQVHEGRFYCSHEGKKTCLQKFIEDFSRVLRSFKPVQPNGEVQ